MLFQTLKGNPVQLARVELAFGQMLQRPPLGRAEGEVRSVFHGDDVAGLVAVCSATGWRTSAASSLASYETCSAVAWRSARPRSVTTTPASRIDLALSTDTSASAMSSQIVTRGQVVRHASIVSRYVRGRAATQARSCRVNAFVVIGLVYAAAGGLSRSPRDQRL